MHCPSFPQVSGVPAYFLECLMPAFFLKCQCLLHLSPEVTRAHFYLGCLVPTYFTQAFGTHLFPSVSSGPFPRSVWCLFFLCWLVPTFLPRKSLSQPFSTVGVPHLFPKGRLLFRSARGERWEEKWSCSFFLYIVPEINYVQNIMMVLVLSSSPHTISFFLYVFLSI